MQTVEDLPEGQIRPPPLAPGSVPITESQPQTSGDTVGDGEDADANLKFSLHPDDPANFLKLCAALRILIRRKLSDDDISQAERLISQYCGELIHVSFIYFAMVLINLASSSFMDLVHSNQTIIMRLMLALLHVTLAPSMTSGHSCSSASIRF